MSTEKVSDIPNEYKKRYTLFLDSSYFSIKNNKSGKKE